MAEAQSILAARLGKSVHVSPLRFRLMDLYEADRRTNASCLEDWLVDAANARGANVVYRVNGPPDDWQPPDREVLSDTDLTVALCQLQCLDRPQILRLAAQMISRRAVSADRLFRAAERERIEPVLAELARQALLVDAGHALWRSIARRYEGVERLRDVLLHWTRLAEPVMKDGRCNAERWRLVA